MDSAQRETDEFSQQCSGQPAQGDTPSKNRNWAHCRLEFSTKASTSSSIWLDLLLFHWSLDLFKVIHYICIYIYIFGYITHNSRIFPIQHPRLASLDQEHREASNSPCCALVACLDGCSLPSNQYRWSPLLNNAVLENLIWGFKN